MECEAGGEGDQQDGRGVVSGDGESACCCDRSFGPEDLKECEQRQAIQNGPF